MLLGGDEEDSWDERGGYAGVGGVGGGGEPVGAFPGTAAEYGVAGGRSGTSSSYY